jgi:DNA-binding SARP family transcriptional activator
VAIELRILGPLEVLVDGRPVRLGGPKQRLLLTALLIQPNLTVSSDRLIDQLWSTGAPATAAKALQVHVSQARKLLPEGTVETRPSGYAVRVEPEGLDRDRFERLTADGMAKLAAGAIHPAAELLREALLLWRGPALADAQYEPFAQAEIVRLEELRLVCTEARIEADLVAGLRSDHIAELEGLVPAHPYRERLRGQLMRALYQTGRQAEALALYQETRELLLEELGIEPSQELKNLELAILRQDSSIGPTPAAVFSAPPEAPPPTTRTRKLVTVLCSDVTAGPERSLDPEAFDVFMAAELARAAQVVADHGGVAERVPGERLIGIFGVPVLHEDDATRAMKAALGIRGGLPGADGVAGQMAVRIGVASGEVVVPAGATESADVGGELVSTAARLALLALPGEIVVSELTCRLGPSNLETEALGEGRPDPALAIHSRRLVGVPARRPSVPDRRLVNREAELAQLRSIVERAFRECVPQLVTLVGEPGVGKSRLAAELAREFEQEATVLHGRCLPYGEGITYWPLREIVEQLGGRDRGALRELIRDEPDGGLIAERLEVALGVEAASVSTEEVFWAARRLFESLSRRRPVLALVEDLHWAEPTMLDLLEHVAARAAAAPLVLLCPARPELLDDRPALGAGRRQATSLWLEPLHPEHAAELLAETAPDLTTDERVRLEIAAQGNPLFLEQLALFVRERPRSETDPALPPTIRAILAARLERLGPGERAIVDAAAVIGTEFWMGAVLELLPAEARGNAQHHLDVLLRRELVEPHHSPVPAEDAFRFSHSLVQSVAYGSIPKTRRAEQHELFTDWAARRLGDRSAEIEEILGYHLEQAHRYRRETGDNDRALGERASRHLTAAGNRALMRDDLGAATNLLGRAAALLEPGSADRGFVEIDLAAAFSENGELQSARSVLDDVLSTASDALVQANARLEELHLRSLVEPSEAIRLIPAETDRLEPVLTEAGDSRGLCRLHKVRALARWADANARGSSEAWRESLRFAREAGNERERIDLLTWLASAALFGPTPVAQALDECAALLTQVHGHAFGEVGVLHPLAGLHAMAGDFSTAHQLLGRANAILEDVGRGMYWAVSHAEVLVSMLEGDFDAAERMLVAGAGRLEEIGERGFLSLTVGLLARVLLEQGRLEEARIHAERSRELAAPEDITAQLAWRGPLARTAVTGGHAGAELLAGEAVELAARTDLLCQQGDAFLDLAVVLELCDRSADARAAGEQAAAKYAEKGDVVSLAKAARFVDRMVRR